MAKDYNLFKIEINPIEPVIELCNRYRGFAVCEWIEIPTFKMNIYIRRAKRLIEKEITDTIELANFEIPVQHRGRGFFTSFLKIIESYSLENNLVVYVECVHNKNLRDFLVRNGYAENPIPGYEKSYFKRPQ